MNTQTNVKVKASKLSNPWYCSAITVIGLALGLASTQALAMLAQAL